MLKNNNKTVGCKKKYITNIPWINFITFEI